ncbi:hypothetical protein T12_9229 [Trichinella patagoniensis]|uniref:Uncharacterized protein n=1 Tax=Trichinella patagoniensis TaxID=990121 RepID=A0A0V1A2M8_9BILA|nr:hypothetical protein T12_9229 [Trichinella patagoniensis]
MNFCRTFLKSVKSEMRQFAMNGDLKIIMTNVRCSNLQNQNLSLTVIKWKFMLLASYSCEANKRQDCGLKFAY